MKYLRKVCKFTFNISLGATLSLPQRPPGWGYLICSMCKHPSAAMAIPHSFCSPSLSSQSFGVHSSLSWRQMAFTESSKQQSYLSVWHAFPCLFSPALRQSQAQALTEFSCVNGKGFPGPFTLVLWSNFFAISIVCCSKSSMIKAFFFR